MKPNEYLFHQNSQMENQFVFREYKFYKCFEDSGHGVAGWLAGGLKQAPRLRVALPKLSFNGRAWNKPSGLRDRAAGLAGLTQLLGWSNGLPRWDDGRHF